MKNIHPEAHASRAATFLRPFVALGAAAALLLAAGTADAAPKKDFRLA